MSDERKQQILDVINRELKAAGGSIDPLSLAGAIDAALGADTLDAGPSPVNIIGPAGPGSSPRGIYARTDEGRTPEELNASNDE